MLRTSLVRNWRGLLLPALLGTVLAAAVGLTVVAPASASGSFTVSATATGTDADTISITASGTGGSSDYVYVYVNPSGTPCAASPNDEQNLNESGLTPSPNNASASGPFSFTTSITPATGRYVVCGYLGSFYSPSATAQSDAVTTSPCFPDTSFTVGGVTVGTTRMVNVHGKSEQGDYHGFVSFTVQSTFPGYSSNGGAPQLQALITVTNGSGDFEHWTTTSAKSGKGEVEDELLTKTGGQDTISILAYPWSVGGRCTKSDGTVVSYGSEDGAYHAPAQTLKVDFGAACKGGTATLDGDAVAVKNDSASHPDPTAYGPEKCDGSISGAKSGTCTQFTKLAKGYACVRHKVVKAKKQKNKHRKRKR
jgi:hypothetical protein